MVAGLSRARVMELFDVRVRLETYLLERSAPQLDHAALNKITDIERRLEATIDHDQWLLLNRELHRELFFAADAPFTLDLVATITARTTRYLSTASGGQGVRRKSEAEQEHRDIIQALREGDVQQAVAVLAQHVEGTRSRVAELLDVMNQAHAITDSTIQSTQQEEPDGGN